MSGRVPWLILAVSLSLQARPEFDPLKDVSLDVVQGVLTLTVPAGVHVKVQTFRVTLLSRGTLRPALPPATGRDDTGDPIWRGSVRVPLKGDGLEDPSRIQVTYQPCTEAEDGRCFLPVKRTLAVPLADLP